eukprot:4573221-Pyramimonas_sp.AAC.1
MCIATIIRPWTKHPGVRDMWIIYKPTCPDIPTLPDSLAYVACILRCVRVAYVHTTLPAAEHLIASSPKVALRFFARSRRRDVGSGPQMGHTSAGGACLCLQPSWAPETFTAPPPK